MSVVTLESLLGPRLQQEASLARYTAARIGGPAEYLVVARESLDDLQRIITTAWENEIPVRVMGGGANVLVSDQGVRGLVVVNKVSEVKFGDWHDGRAVSATSGTNLGLLAHKCAARGFAGMEWAVSVPGTVGGALVNNAGAHGDDMAASAADVVVLEPGGPKIYSNDEMAFGYRTSQLKRRDDRRFLVLLATFILHKDDPATIKGRMNEFGAYRKQTQPPGASLGSIFKNPDGDYAGRLIEACGLKGHRIGDAQVSDVHANFFVNAGDASAANYRALIEHVQAVVQRERGVMLEPEIEFLGEW